MHCIPNLGTINSVIFNPGTDDTLNLPVLVVAGWLAVGVSMESPKGLVMEGVPQLSK